MSEYEADALLAEIARLKSELTGVRQNLTQIAASRDAERAARRAVEADNAALKEPIERLYRWHAVGSKTDYGLHGPGCDICDVVRVYRAGHPGAALLTELDAARTFIATTWRVGVDGMATPEEQRQWLADSHAYKQSAKARE